VKLCDSHADTALRIAYFYAAKTTHIHCDATKTEPGKLTSRYDTHSKKAPGFWGVAMSDDATHSEDRLTLWLSAELKRRLEDEHLEYGDSLSGWVREAVQLRLLVEHELARRDADLPADRQEREDLVADLLRAGIDARDGE